MFIARASYSSDQSFSSDASSADTSAFADSPSFSPDFAYTSEAACFQTAVEPAAYQGQPGSYRIADYGPERRRHSRRPTRMRAEARRMDNTLVARRSPRLGLTVLDISPGGIRATSRMPVVAGERLQITLPPESGIVRRIYGKVLRCSARQDGWGLAIQFDFVPAA